MAANKAGGGAISRLAEVAPVTSTELAVGAAHEQRVVVGMLMPPACRVENYVRRLHEAFATNPFSDFPPLGRLQRPSGGKSRVWGRPPV
ncbi:MAG TPA: hypothetical protein VF278_11765 [Pirellulales bacterium]